MVGFFREWQRLPSRKMFSQPHRTTGMVFAAAQPAGIVGTMHPCPEWWGHNGGKMLHVQFWTRISTGPDWVWSKVRFECEVFAYLSHSTKWHEIEIPYSISQPVVPNDYWITSTTLAGHCMVAEANIAPCQGMRNTTPDVSSPSYHSIATWNGLVSKWRPKPRGRHWTYVYCLPPLCAPLYDYQRVGVIEKDGRPIWMKEFSTVQTKPREIAYE